MLASIRYLDPKNLPIVRAFAGDSTITTGVPSCFFAMRVRLLPMALLGAAGSNCQGSPQQELEYGPLRKVVLSVLKSASDARIRSCRIGWADTYDLPQCRPLTRLWAFAAIAQLGVMLRSSRHFAVVEGPNAQEF